MNECKSVRVYVCKSVRVYMCKSVCEYVCKSVGVQGSMYVYALVCVSVYVSELECV